LHPTRAAILLFGSGPVLRQLLPRAVVDCQWIPANWSDALPDQRWSDRLLVEENLIRAWQAIVQKFMAHSETPLTDHEAKAFAIACRNGDLRLRDVKASAGLSARDAQAVLDRLLVEVLVEEVTPGNRTHVQLAEHLVNRLASPFVPAPRLVSDQPRAKPANSVTDQPLTVLTDTQRQIVAMCDVYRSLGDLMEKLGLTHRTFFRRRHLEPLLKGGVLQQRFPDQPNHPQQAYVVTETGLKLITMQTSTQQTDQVGGS
jgi:ATP-dependent DNA helicase RecG